MGFAEMALLPRVQRNVEKIPIINNRTNRLNIARMGETELGAVLSGGWSGGVMVIANE